MAALTGNPGLHLQKRLCSGFRDRSAGSQYDANCVYYVR
jgi:hypothetical protein